MDVGIAVPWKHLISTLSLIQKSIDEGNDVTNVTGLDGLRQLHESCLEQIRARLFLRRKQEKIRSSFEAVFDVILKYGTLLGREGDFETKAYLVTFAESITDVLRLLRRATDKAPNIAAAENAEDDQEATKILLTRLNWNGFYNEPAPG